MKHNDELEKKLAGTQVPQLTEGHHRDALRHVLMESSSTPLRKEVKKSMKFRRILIYAVCAVLILATAAWATYQHKKNLEVRVKCDGDTATAFVTDENGTREYKLPVDGEGGMLTVLVGEDGVPTVVNEFPPEIREAIKSGNYTMDEEKGKACIGDGEITLYHYTFNLPDGRKMELKSPRKLEEVLKEEDDKKE